MFHFDLLHRPCQVNLVDFLLHIDCKVQHWHLLVVMCTGAVSSHHYVRVDEVGKVYHDLHCPFIIFFCLRDVFLVPVVSEDQALAISPPTVGDGRLDEVIIIHISLV